MGVASSVGPEVARIRWGSWERHEGVRPAKPSPSGFVRLGHALERAFFELAARSHPATPALDGVDRAKQEIRRELRCETIEMGSFRARAWGRAPGTPLRYVGSDTPYDRTRHERKQPMRSKTNVARSGACALAVLGLLAVTGCGQNPMAPSTSEVGPSSSQFEYNVGPGESGGSGSGVTETGVGAGTTNNPKPGRRRGWGHNHP
jgi:hypothetical protein